MQEYSLFLLRALTAILLLSSSPIRASHQIDPIAADISYTHLGNGYYKIRLVFYSGCSSIPRYKFENILVNNTCGIASYLVANLMDSFDASALCPSLRQLDVCHGGTIPGYRAWIYETDTFHVDSTCSFSASYNRCCRSTASNLTTTGSMYIETQLNRAPSNYGANNSPRFLSQLIGTSIIGSPTSLSFAAIDLDGDSLTYQLVNPMQNNGTPCIFTSGADSAHPFGSFTVAGSFSFDNLTGQLNYNLNTQGKFIVAVRVDEYRHGIKLGSVVQDLQLTSINSSNKVPYVFDVLNSSSVLSGKVVSGSAIEVKSGDTIDFTVRATDDDLNQQIKLDSIYAAYTAAAMALMPGATLTYTHLHPNAAFDTIAIHFHWSPNCTTAGNFVLPIMITDDNCTSTSSGFYAARTAISYHIHVSTGLVKAGADQYFCPGGFMATLTTNAAHPIWSDINGGVPSGLVQGPLNSNTIVVSPTQTSYYVVYDSTATGCQNRDTVVVYVGITYSTNIQTICAGDSVVVNGHVYTSTGTYIDTLPNGGACNAIVTTALTVSPALASSQAITVCAGGSYVYHGNSYSASGVYTDILTASTGCDSTVTTILTVSAPLASSQSVSICAGTTYTYHGHNYGTGTYIDTLISSTGCDSVVTTVVTTLPASTASITASACSSTGYTIGTHTYYATGVYTDTLASAHGCDSIVTLTLTIDTVVAHYTIYPDTNHAHNWFALDQCSGAGALSYTWTWGDGSSSTGSSPSHTFATADNYNICVAVTDSLGCSASYCDSSTYIYKAASMISIKVVKSIPNTVSGVSTIANDDYSYTIYPNPTDRLITIKALGADYYKTTATLIDYTGRIIRNLIQDQTIPAQGIQVDMTNISTGIYLIKLVAEDGKTGIHRIAVR
jgi:hypothetical protein